MIEHDRLAAALALAHDAHRIQKRKGTDIPYIAHPMAVAALVLEYGGSEDQAIAALLHDTIEDGGEAYADRIGEAFGPDVLAMVRDCTDGSFENKAAVRTPHAKYVEWKARKQAYMQHLRAMPAESPSLLVSACDKLHNARPSSPTCVCWATRCSTGLPAGATAPCGTTTSLRASSPTRAQSRRATLRAP